MDEALRSRIALLEIEPSEALPEIRRALRVGEGATDIALLESLRAATWKLLTGQMYGAEIRQWYDLIVQLAGFYVARDPKLEAKLSVLSDLLLESIRFGEVHSPEDVASRQHVLGILNSIDALDKDQNGARRSDVLKQSGLKQSNMSRVLANLQSLGFVTKKMRGREAFLFLTARGKTVIHGDGTNSDPGLQLNPEAPWFKTGTGN